ncbi:endoplasmic reticulum membrane sensor NFE2L1a [Platichthys flesus]|uniref:endoplasmic reticulum membrane sensor NFE2L1a n=1 Tax=Platichthys flesus TaxID=8260 RepID=UPI002DBABF0F|nr:endoplasmic reticulum membrane sensor NFE2L1a [Platichthys flesus]XP_062263137.1 endoplasmic reticulum membrane sensor NFE2L1a [Platichthys flesus]
MTMLCLKKYFTEGLIQVAILLSLCGVRVDVELETYLPPSLQEMILGQTSTLTQTQFHNLRNHLEDGHDLHPKNVDLDGFFTTRRLLGWVRSLDRLQIPHSELETWLVQREPDPLTIDQSSLLERAPARVERDLIGLTVEPRPGLGTLQEEVEAEQKEEEIQNQLHYSDGLDESGEEEEDEEDDMARMHSHYMRTLGGGRTEGSDSRTYNRELSHNVAEQSSFPLQECLRLLEETFPFTEEQELSDDGGRGGDLGRHHSGREPLLSPIIPTDNPNLDLELDWQDLFAIMEPENTDVDTMTSLDNVLESRPPGPPPVESETFNLNCNNLDNVITDAHQGAHLAETPLQHGFLWPASQPQLEPALLSLTPSAELDDHTSAFNTWDVSRTLNVNTLHRPPDHMDLLADEPSEDFSLGQDADDNSSTFNINLLAQDPVDNLAESQSVEYALYPGDLASFNVNLNSRDLTAPSPSLSPDRNDMTQNLPISPSVFLVDEDVGDEDLPVQISDLLEDAAILDEMRLLDLALEEGFSPEMAARLEEEGYLDTDRDGDHSSTAVTEDQSEPGRHQQDGDEADTDSGLSLDFSYSPASPCASEASYYSSSSSSASNSSSSSISDVESPFYEDKEEDTEEGLVASDMEVEVTIKQEELDEEEMGAVGGGYPEDIKKLFPVNYGDHKLLNGFTWLEQIDHDHTYNQPFPSASSPSGNILSKHTKSSPQHPNPRHYHYSSSRHISETKMRSRDERRARGLKIPFSSELIINLPVEEFNDLLCNYKLNEEQLSLIRDIRRRGKNKIAAQNCRKRKLNVLQGLEDNVSGLRRRRSRLVREKQEALKNLQEMKRRLGTLYQEVFSRLRDGEGRPLDSAEYSINFAPNGSVMVASHQQEGWVPLTGEKTSKKQRNKKK